MCCFAQLIDVSQVPSVRSRFRLPGGTSSARRTASREPFRFLRRLPKLSLQTLEAGCAHEVTSGRRDLPGGPAFTFVHPPVAGGVSVEYLMSSRICSGHCHRL